MKIKILITTAATVILTAMAARADDWWSTHMYYDKECKPAFNANEFSVDAFGSLMGGEHSILAWPNTSIRHQNGLWGGGLGANYFWSKDVGIGVDSAAYSGTTHFVQYIDGNLFVRFPIDAIRLAPYIFGGGGRAYNPGWSWMGDVGFGLDYRLNPKLGLFSDARYIWQNLPGGSAGWNLGHEQLVIRAGIRFAF